MILTVGLWIFVVVTSGDGVVIVVVVLFLFFLFFFMLCCGCQSRVVVVGVVVVVANGRGGCDWCYGCFLNNGIYYFIMEDILFCCNVYIILLY